MNLIAEEETGLVSRRPLDDVGDERAALTVDTRERAHARIGDLAQGKTRCRP